MLIQRKLFEEQEYVCRECGRHFVVMSSDIREFLDEEYQAHGDWANFNLFCTENCLKNYNAYHEYLSGEFTDGEDG